MVGAKNLTKTKLADMAGYSRSHVTNIEDGLSAKNGRSILSSYRQMRRNGSPLRYINRATMQCAGGSPMAMRSTCTSMCVPQKSMATHCREDAAAFFYDLFEIKVLMARPIAFRFKKATAARRSRKAYLMVG